MHVEKRVSTEKVERHLKQESGESVRRRPSLSPARLREQPNHPHHDAVGDESNHEGHVVQVDHRYVREVNEHRLEEGFGGEKSVGCGGEGCRRG